MIIELGSRNGATFFEPQGREVAEMVSRKGAAAQRFWWVDPLVELQRDVFWTAGAQSRRDGFSQRRGGATFFGGLTRWWSYSATFFEPQGREGAELVGRVLPMVKSRGR